MSTIFVTILLLILYFGISLYQMRGITLQAKELAVCGIMIAFTLILDSIRIPLPTGATMSLCSPVPLLLLAILWSPKLAIVSGWVCGILALYLVPAWQPVHWGQIFAEHLVCFSCLGYAGIFGNDKRWKILCGIALATVIKICGHTLSGVLFFSQNAWDGWGGLGIQSGIQFLSEHSAMPAVRSNCVGTAAWQSKTCHWKGTFVMSFVAECIQDSLPIWEECLNSPFLRKLENGTLEESSFLGYIVDDSLYLREYARVFAWGMTKARTMEDVRICYSLLSFVNEGEGSTRLYYLNRYGLKDQQIQNLPQRPENKAYTDCMLEAAKSGGIIECLMACLPCMISYHWIFRKLLERSPEVKETPYWPLVRDYASKEYHISCQKWAAYTDQICKDLSSEQKAKCMRIFRDCSLHELHFWEMSEKPRADV